MGVVESSPHYLEILKLMLDGKSGRQIENHLFTNYGEKISHATLNTYKKQNADIVSLIQQVEMQQRTIEDGKLQMVDNKLAENNQAEQMIIKEINTGIDVLNLIRGGLVLADEQQILESFFKDKDVSSKDKVQVVLQLAKLDLDWKKSNEPLVNINNNQADFTLFDKSLKEIYEDGV